jgi:quercetin dioxygenase-like cupin family protein
MHYVGKVDWSFGDGAAAAGTATSQGLARSVLIGPEQGAVHTELAVGVLAPGGWLGRHIHSFEEALYVLEGQLILEIDGKVNLLRAGDYALMPVATWHTLHNPAGEPTRWLSVNTPQRLGPTAPRKDTFFEPGRPDLARLQELAAPPRFGDPATRFVGHYEGTGPQLETLRIKDEARGRPPAGMDTALLAYSGISVKMLLDKVSGAALLTMFTVDYELGGAAQAHDHPFEETYFFLAGEVECELDGELVNLKPGDVVFAGVGSVHGFYNVGNERVRWIETQAPQPPTRHSYRWIAPWKKLEEAEKAAMAERSAGNGADLLGQTGNR